MKVLIDRLLDMACIDVKAPWNWPGSEPLCLDEVLRAKASGLAGTKDAYGDTGQHPTKKTRNKSYHIARIIYYMDNPDEISGIEVDNPCSNNAILPECTVIDGRHRMAAGILLGLKTVDI